MNIAELQDQLAKIMPLLDQNISETHKEYMSGNLPAGAWRYVLGRHNTALNILDVPEESADADTTKFYFTTATWLTIDLRYICKQNEDNAPLERWLQFFVDNGFTETISVFNVPKMKEDSD